MPPLTTVIAIAVSCSVIFIVSAIVGTVIWIRVRQDRLSLAVANAKHNGYALQQYHGETLTELSREEGTALRQYGQLPYGKPSEWGVLSSRESLIQSPIESDTSSPLEEKARDVRRSLTRSLSSRSARLSRHLLGSQRLSSLSPLTERSEKRQSASPTVSGIDDGVTNSAVEGAFELATETTPRHTPDREEEQIRANLTMRPVSGAGAWPLMHQKERSGSLYPLMEDKPDGPPYSSSGLRGGSITTQSSGAAPEQPVPPPPCAYPPNRFRLSKNDSTCLSSLSLETADSSILDDSRRTSTNVDSTFTSPALPPCPTFAPFDANDVGRMEYDRRAFAPPGPVVPSPFVFPASSSAMWEGQRLEPDRTSPRRSMTTRSPTHSMERISPTPRRSESLSETKSRRDSSLWVKPLDLSRPPSLNPIGSNGGLLPHFSQMQRHTMHGDQRRDLDPFYSATGNAATANDHISRPRPASAGIQEAPLQGPTGHLKPPLPSALKGGSGTRKGHRRQNCVRISIHPPITFGGSVFSPMAEEPELEGFDASRRQLSNVSTPQISFRSSVSSLCMDRTAHPDLHKEHPRITEIPDEPSRNSQVGPPKRRSNLPADATDSTLHIMDLEKSLPEIITTLPPPKIDTTLSSTPSPEKNSPVWMIPNYNSSPTGFENSSNPGSPRRSAVKGPRHPPPKSAARNSYRSLNTLEDTVKTPLSPSTRPQRPQNLRKEPRSVAEPSPRTKHLVGPRNQGPHGHPGRNDAPSTRQTPGHHRRSSSGVSKPPLANGGIIVPIWEDKASGRKGARQSSVATSESSGSQGKPPRAKCHGPADKSPGNPNYAARQGFRTPTKKPVGLGIGAATPASLYDGDGFLKE
ncbi:hypothetical protein BO94DRAFT_7996 [Aspergillus sclerotioniger CBS 115572]|uniref:Uncharacterized protein n=1 Tax=Aspergillus sclerotioniger CBS 115572 TaxID=1450535 RepID=A0A317XCZ0_9EURO|nr:hypothetical protein BO94DRAFT_7996 [Aspergillus sclerotioniger CBS 115572]PWY96389.1 hypothetical protein BO94DRAFT_7996 [Aspergillus sclerotioniger CBS 115572]